MLRVSVSEKWRLEVQTSHQFDISTLLDLLLRSQEPGPDLAFVGGAGVGLDKYRGSKADQRGLPGGTQRRVEASDRRREGFRIDLNWTLSNSFAPSRARAVRTWSSRSGPASN